MMDYFFHGGPGLPYLFAFLMGLSMLIYGLLDGYDLGVGILSYFEKNTFLFSNWFSISFCERNAKTKAVTTSVIPIAATHLLAVPRIECISSSSCVATTGALTL